MNRVFLSLFFVGIFLLFANTTLAAPIVAGSFSTTWKTDNPGTSASNRITIPTTGTGYNYDIYWENVSSSTQNGTLTGRTGATTITFPSIGTYRVDITGSFPRIYFNNGGDRRKILTIEQWGNIAWTSMERAFYGAENLQGLATDVPNLSNATSTAYMFSGALSFNQNINNWDVSSITNMSAMFQGTTLFNQPLDTWDVSNVTTIFSMFDGATSFNQSLNAWNLASATNLDTLFARATSFNQPLDNWDMSNVTAINRMFSGATSFNQPLDSWNTGNINAAVLTFRDATSFNQPLNSWDVSQLQYVTQMFDGATSFNQPLDNWSTAPFQETNYMFAGATSFNQPINNWDMDEVFDMKSMFEGASSFNQDLSDWNVIGPDLYGFGIFENMFLDSALDTTNYSRILTNWSTLSVATSQNLGTVGPSSNLTSYCSTAQAARDILVTTYSWSITDGGSTPCFTISYTAGLNATLIGQGTQNVIGGEDSTEVEVVPDAGFRFVKWSDESTQNPRTDLAVGANITVSAIIESDPSGGGSSATRIGSRTIDSLSTAVPVMNNPDTTMLPQSEESTLKNFFASVRQLVDYLQTNEEEIKNLSPQERLKIITTLRDALLFILNLVPGV